MTLYVSNLPGNTTEEKLKELLRSCGTSGSVLLPREEQTGELRGFALINIAEEDEAIALLDGLEWRGNRLHASKAMFRVGHERRGRRKVHDH